MALRQGQADSGAVAMRGLKQDGSHGSTGFAELFLIKLIKWTV